jgi:ABC-type iron transport system FetAB permease component
MRHLLVCGGCVLGNVMDARTLQLHEKLKEIIKKKKKKKKEKGNDSLIT